MRNPDYKQIANILSQKPEGLKVNAIAINLYNQGRGFFTEKKDYEKLYKALRQYLWQQSQKKNSIFEAVDGKRGYYRLRKNYNKQQKSLFNDNYLIEVDEEESKLKEEINKLEQPTLFDFME
ncbi:MAG: hypothetical protein K6E54_10660 [Bacteroidaceae bacterium]|nr:hypothetical protein [Bacteroidaceae bacterium]